MRKIKMLALVIALLAMTSMADVLTKEAFLATAISTITTGATATNGSEFTSREISLGERAHPVVAIIVTFARATGSSSTVDFNFQVSYDMGTTWADYDDGEIQVASNHAAITGTTVRYYTLVSLYGVDFIRLYTVKNNDSASITAVNVTLTTSKR
uniref:Uncharacterized protein n=1 Tax=viral metagenome TaxID=1070528 RepID=A0A6M3J1M4_9ZZZZ